MVRNSRSKFSKELEHSFNDGIYTENIPEVGLFAGILERSVRDLNHETADKYDRLDAIEWFLCSIDWVEQGAVRYIDCINILDLTEDQVKFVNALVQEAIDHDQQQAKRKES